ncbi:3664_t:CDS:1, partial [Dentiscutata heterogama]
PEVLTDKKFTCEANIYSFGTLLYEIITGLSPDRNDAHDAGFETRICSEVKPKIPEHTPKLFKQLMNQFWRSDPSQRPKANELIDKLDQWHKNPPSEINNQTSKEKALTVIVDNNLKAIVPIAKGAKGL